MVAGASENKVWVRLVKGITQKLVYFAPLRLQYTFRGVLRTSDVACPV